MDRITNWLSSNGTKVQRCPDCDEAIGAESINIKEGFALCTNCGNLSRLSELNYSQRSTQEILSNPPSGCAVASSGQGVVARASLRSITGFVFTCGFALFWNGIVSVFVSLALAGLYSNLIGPLPAWFPAAGLKDGKPEMNGGPMDLRMTLFLCLFLVPFVTVGVGMAGAALINLIGKVEVVIDELDSYVATGVGILQWKRRFDPRQVRAVHFGDTTWKSDGGSNRVIELLADRTIKFGSLLAADRLEWLRSVLKELLVNGDATRHGSTLPYLTWLERKR